jgi:hypothetical protein
MRFWPKWRVSKVLREWLLMSQAAGWIAHFGVRIASARADRIFSQCSTFDLTSPE